VEVVDAPRSVQEDAPDERPFELHGVVVDHFEERSARHLMRHAAFGRLLLLLLCVSVSLSDCVLLCGCGCMHTAETKERYELHNNAYVRRGELCAEELQNVRVPELPAGA
jgi:hypothetical protein